MTSTSTSLPSRLQDYADLIREQWRPLFFPALVFWLLATFVTGSLISSFDISEYDHYAHAVLRLPFLHSLPKEYPFPAVAIFLAPLVLPILYRWAFAIPVGIVLLALFVSFARDDEGTGELERARRLLVYLVLGGIMFITSRYDIFAAAAAFWGIRAAMREDWSRAWTWTSIGFAIKLFPAALWPVLLIAEWRRTRRLPVKRLAWIGGAVAVTLGLPALFNGSGAVSPFHYYSARPPEVGSIPAGLSMIFNPVHWTYVSSFHSINIRSPIVGPIADAVLATAVVSCLFVWWLQLRGRLPVEAAALATLTAIVLGGKVFSVQYLLWLIPFWALYRIRVSWVLAACLNSVIFPLSLSATAFGYFGPIGYVRTLVSTNFVRDLLVLAGSIAWFRAVRMQPAGEGRSATDEKVLRTTAPLTRTP